MGPDPRWADAQRLEAWAGEARVNLVRAAALVVFYANHLLNVYLFTDDPAAAGAFHLQASGLALAWAASAVALHYCLAIRWVPAWLKLAATGVDLVLVASLLMLSPEGPRSPLLLLLFLIVASAPLRMSIGLIWLATLGAMAAYLIVLGHHAFVRVGWEAYYAEGGPRVPRAQQLLVLLALATAGVLAGQVVRQARRMVAGYPVEVSPPSQAA